WPRCSSQTRGRRSAVDDAEGPEAADAGVGERFDAVGYEGTVFRRLGAEGFEARPSKGRPVAGKTYELHPDIPVTQATMPDLLRDLDGRPEAERIEAGRPLPAGAQHL
ncbi:MAG: hypothetical protein ACRDZY_02685, partial [Acidimicrobiales bacterium]